MPSTIPIRRQIMKENRFYYTKSMVYGWAVYDRQTNQPAWDVCAEIFAASIRGREWQDYRGSLL